VNVTGRRPSDALNDVWVAAKRAGGIMINDMDAAGYQNCPTLEQMQNFTKNEKKKLLLGD